MAHASHVAMNMRGDWGAWEEGGLTTADQPNSRQLIRTPGRAARTLRHEQTVSNSAWHADTDLVCRSLVYCQRVTDDCLNILCLDCVACSSHNTLRLRLALHRRALIGWLGGGGGTSLARHSIVFNWKNKLDTLRNSIEFQC